MDGRGDSQTIATALEIQAGSASQMLKGDRGDNHPDKFVRFTPSPRRVQCDAA